MHANIVVEPTPPQKFFSIVLLIAFLVLLCVLIAQASEYTDEQIVNAIYRAEGGQKAPFAYGIRSIPYRDIKDARQICLNSVRNGRKRWIKAGRPYDLITFIGMRYCPPKAHPLNSNWVKNVKYFLNKN